MGKDILKILVLGIAIVLVAGSAQAQMPGGNFSADMVSKTGKETFKSKMYVSGQKIRMEAEGNIIITHLDKNISWVIMPSEKMYLEQPIDMGKTPKTSKTLGDNEIERVSLGKEKIDGQDTEKFKITYSEGGKNESAYQWLLDSQIPVKIAAVDGSWSMEYHNISTKAPADNLFEIPAGYQKFSMPSMGGMMQQLMNK